VAWYLKLRFFGRDLRGLLSVILHLSRMSLSSSLRLGTLGLSRKSSLLPIGRPTSCPTCVSSIFIMMNTSRIELPTSVTLSSKFSNIFSIASNLVRTTLLILACSSTKFLNCAQRGTKSRIDELALNQGLPWTWPYSSHSSHVDLALVTFRS
jgi:hypothetical protein